ncbi:MAG: DNA-3-methyladenine glycosylase [bacterium]|nr:DNA-3-methyladenine glycosylase [bacterium]
MTLGFYRRPSLEVAPDLLGRELCRSVGREVLRGRIAEVEVYDGTRDRASHAFPGRTRRNAPMFARGGIAYVYLIYGVHHCLNVVTAEEGHPAAILIRAAEAPVDGANAAGPGRLTRAFSIDRELDGESLVGSRIWLEAGSPAPASRIRRTARIGIDYAGAWARRRLRFVIAGHPDLSGPRSMNV